MKYITTLPNLISFISRPVSKLNRNVASPVLSQNWPRNGIKASTSDTGSNAADVDCLSRVSSSPPTTRDQGCLSPTATSVHELPGGSRVSTPECSLPTAQSVTVHASVQTVSEVAVQTEGMEVYSSQLPSTLVAHGCSSSASFSQTTTDSIAPSTGMSTHSPNHLRSIPAASNSNLQTINGELYDKQPAVVSNTVPLLCRSCSFNTIHRGTTQICICLQHVLVITQL